MNRLTEQIIIDILNREMAMPADAVWLRDQNRKIPNDNGLYIAVGMTSVNVTSNVTYMRTLDPATFTNWDQIGALWDEDSQTWDVDQIEVNEVQQQENIQIDMLSRSNSVLSRRWEVTAALQSFYAQRQQELNNFKLPRIPRSFVNASAAEGGYILNRYSLTVPCLVWYRKEKALRDYYDDFPARVDTANTIANPATRHWDEAGEAWDTPGQVWDGQPLIEFDINSEGIVS